MSLSPDIRRGQGYRCDLGPRRRPGWSVFLGLDILQGLHGRSGPRHGEICCPARALRVNGLRTYVRNVDMELSEGTIHDEGLAEQALFSLVLHLDPLRTRVFHSNQRGVWICHAINGWFHDDGWFIRHSVVGKPNSMFQPY